MEAVHEDGFFEAVLPRGTAPFPYRLRVRWPGAEEPVETADPYAFAPLIGDFDLYLLGEGTHLRLWEVLGARPMEVDGVPGVRFAVWAPAARRVSVVGEFNQWDGRRHPMRLHPAQGVWEIFVPGVEAGAVYKYEILSAAGEVFLKSDPLAFAAELRPETASVVRGSTGTPGSDGAWMERRREADWCRGPMAVYEVHLGSWRRAAARGPAPLVPRPGARAGRLRGGDGLHPRGAAPGDGAPVRPVVGLPGHRLLRPHQPPRHARTTSATWWTTSTSAASASSSTGCRRTSPRTRTRSALRRDGALRARGPAQGEHPDWGTLVFNFGRNEVRNFLLSNALFWLEEYHVDGLRVDAVASMLYLDYSREAGEWLPNRYGGRENLEAIEFLQQLNAAVRERHPGRVMIAEESTAWPGVTQPPHLGGLGFHLKWNMGWMNDFLRFIAEEPVHRKYHFNLLTFSLMYAFSERFVLPFSHDEVVHGKGSLIGKMPGDGWQKAANLRLALGAMWGHPGKKLLFMGIELGQWREWSESRSLDWHLLEQPLHAGIQRWMRDLNALYRAEPALWEAGLLPGGVRVDRLPRRGAEHPLLRAPRRRVRGASCSSSATSPRCRGTPTTWGCRARAATASC
jgi:1,4-alpha-glucan branching enzyme